MPAHAGDRGGPLTENVHAAQWEKRLAAVGAAQARYLWVLVVAGIFYLGVNATVFAKSPTLPSTIHTPIIGLDVSATALWA
ncbi:MAG TPA: hypothetical protein VJ957_12345, partial [Longimicrobiales bacterium]|nr:hypothetical protein [Longimicrobiales bacterium]